MIIRSEAGHLIPAPRIHLLVLTNFRLVNVSIIITITLLRTI